MSNIEHLLHEPNVRLFGPIEKGTFWDFIDQVGKVRASPDKAVVLELTTEGGDPDIARRIALEIRLCRDWHNQETYFVGKTIVYSAGITILSAFPLARRYLTADTVLLIHERRIESEIALKGPMRSNIQILREQLAQMETAEKLENDGFSEFIEGSKFTLDQLYERAKNNLYLTAEEALNLQLITKII
jgi:ATP-dependent protease ClpP protease subunit